MPTSARRALLIVAVLVTLANVADLASTYYAAPDLANEWNILVRRCGLGWGGLIAAKLIGGTLAIAGYGFYLKYRTTCYPSEMVDPIVFCHYLWFGDDVSRREEVSGASWRRILVHIGHFWAGMQVLVVWVAVDNVLMRHGYYWPMRIHSEGAYHAIQALTVAVSVMSWFYVGNYRRFLAVAGPLHRARLEQLSV